MHVHPAAPVTLPHTGYPTLKVGYLPLLVGQGRVEIAVERALRRGFRKPARYGVGVVLVGCAVLLRVPSACIR